MYKNIYKSENFNLDILTECISEFFYKEKRTNMKKLFQYVVLLHKYDTSDSSKPPVYVDSEIILQSQALAKSEKDLVFKITREIPEEHAGNPDNVEIIIRPF